VNIQLKMDAETTNIVALTEHHLPNPPQTSLVFSR